MIGVREGGNVAMGMSNHTTFLRPMTSGILQRAGIIRDCLAKAPGLVEGGALIHRYQAGIGRRLFRSGVMIESRDGTHGMSSFWHDFCTTNS